MTVLHLPAVLTAVQEKFKTVRSTFCFSVYATSNISLKHCLSLNKPTLETDEDHTPKIGKIWTNWQAGFCTNILACHLPQQLIVSFENKLTVLYTSEFNEDHISELHDQINVRSIPFPKAPSLALLLLLIL